MSKISFLALSLISTLCFAEKQLELTVDTQQQLAMLVSENDYVVLVEINEGKFTGACMVHNKVKGHGQSERQAKNLHSFLLYQPR